MQSVFIDNLWNRCVNRDKSVDTWEQEKEALFAMGIGMEAALHFLYNHQPNKESFYLWLQQNSSEENNIDTNIPDVLSPDDLHFWETNGYIVLKNVIPRTDCEESCKVIMDFIDASPTEPESWYKINEEKKGMMLTLYNNPVLQENRKSAKIKKAYEQIYNTKSIYKVIDKTSFNPPETDNYTFAGSALHWDVSLHLPIPLGLQGLLYLSDCGPHEGAFHCVPGFHHSITEWLSALAKDVEPREIAPLQLKPVPIPGNAGDFVIWHQALPHCATPNKGKTPRIVQYFTYLPEGYKSSQIWV